MHDKRVVHQRMARFDFIGNQLAFIDIFKMNKIG